MTSLNKDCLSDLEGFSEGLWGLSGIFWPGSCRLSKLQQVKLPSADPSCLQDQARFEFNSYPLKVFLTLGDTIDTKHVSGRHTV